MSREREEAREKKNILAREKERERERKKNRLTAEEKKGRFASKDNLFVGVRDKLFESRKQCAEDRNFLR